MSARHFNRTIYFVLVNLQLCKGNYDARNIYFWYVVQRVGVYGVNKCVYFRLWVRYVFRIFLVVLNRNRKNVLAICNNSG